MSSSYLFVYGTLRSDVGHVIHSALTKIATVVGPATVRGDLFVVGEFSVLVPRTDGPSSVVGEVYEFMPDKLESGLRILDSYEGITDANTATHPFRRDRVVAELTDGRKFDAWAYILNRPTEGLERIASGDFLEWRRSRK
jgi:gamma-glutamylcyclotransferase (GGCT)/AIG2-like uncharacterized protein YtfP